MFQDSRVAVYPLERTGAAGVRSVVTMARIIREGGYQVLDIQRGHDIIQSWFAARISRRDVRLLYTPQVPEFIHSRILLGRMDRIVTISRYIRDKLISFSPSLADRISIIRYGINMDSFCSGRIRAGIPRAVRPALDAKIIGIVGDLWKTRLNSGGLAELRKSVANACLSWQRRTNAPEVRRFKKKPTGSAWRGGVLGRQAFKGEMRSFYADIDLAVSNTATKASASGSWKPWPWASRWSPSTPAASAIPSKDVAGVR
jgi:hypothetical protein